MDEKALLDALRTIVREEVAGAEQRITAQTKTMISDAEQRITAQTKSTISDAEQRIAAETKTQISDAEQRIAKSTVTLMDAQFMGQFNLLAEGQEEILRRMPNEDDMAIIDGRLAELEADVALLKKAN